MMTIVLPQWVATQSDVWVATVFTALVIIAFIVAAAHGNE